MKRKRLCAIFSFIAGNLSLASCSSSSFPPTRQVLDISRLYVGAYPTARGENGKTYSQWVYVDFVQGEVQGFHPSVSVDLTSSGLHEFGVSDGGTPRFVDIAERYRTSHLGRELSEFFGSGGMAAVRTGVGDYDPDAPFVSAPVYLSQCGRIVSLSSIAAPGDEPEKSVSYVYKTEIEWRFWLW